MYKKLYAIAALGIAPWTLLADDTDIYVNPSFATGSEPLVMFSLDYRSNLGSTVCSNVSSSCDAAEYFKAEGLEADLPASGKLVFFDVLRLALKLVLSEVNGVSIGLMMNHDNGNKCEGPSQTGCSNGGYMLRGFESLQAGDANGSLSEFLNILNSLPVPQGNLSHSYQGKELFFEFFRYLTGQDIYNGHNGFTDYDSDKKENLDADNPDIAWDTAIEDASNTTYLSPLIAGSTCSSIYTINLMFQVSNQEDDSDDAIKAARNAGGMGGINLSGNKNNFDTVIGYLNDVDLAPATNKFGSAVPEIDGIQNVTSYFIVDPTKINNTTTGYAEAGGTERPLALSENPEELVETLRSILDQILSVSTTFVAASVPVNVFNRASIVDNVYIALFQAFKEPSWTGNLKKLTLGPVTLADGSTELVLKDALDDPAVAGDGRIELDALTFWTDPGALPAPDTSAGEVSGRDGRHVDRGAAGQQIPGFASGNPGMNNADSGARKLFYDSSLSLTALDADKSTTAVALQAALGASTVDEAYELLLHMRGWDVDQYRIDGSLIARDWVLGDPLHSRPLPINYGALGSFSTSNPAIYIAMASNDGFLHMFRNTNTNGSESGREVWAFAPTEVLDKQAILQKNEVVDPRHPYTIDGAPVAITNDANQDGTISGTGEYAWLFVGMRRGASSYYALDVTQPESPSLMWKIDPSVTAFSELGQTFSTPQTGLLDIAASAGSSNIVPVLVFAGGYDTNKDDRATFPPAADTRGNAIYVVNAETGALIWKARKASSTGNIDSDEFGHQDLTHSIPSDVTAVDTNGDGLLDRVLVGDTGGNVWRVDLVGNDPSNWTLVKLAALGLDGVTTGTPTKADDRRFFHAPDLVLSRDSTGAFDAVVIGSGDRADPLSKGGVASDAFYMIKDRGTAIGAGAPTGSTHSNLPDLTSNCLQSADEKTCGVDLSKGWRFDLSRGTAEKNLARPLTFSGNVFFTTYLPPGSNEATTCGPSEGGGAFYAVNLADATAVFNFNLTDDDTQDTSGEPNSADDRAEVLRSGGIPSEVVFIPPGQILRPDLNITNAPGTNRFRTFWQRHEDAVN